MRKKILTPQPRPNLTVQERATLIEHMEKAAQNPRLSEKVRAERATMAAQLRAIQAKRTS